MNKTSRSFCKKRHPRILWSECNKLYLFLIFFIHSSKFFSFFQAFFSYFLYYIFIKYVKSSYHEWIYILYIYILLLYWYKWFSLELCGILFLSQVISLNLFVIVIYNAFILKSLTLLFKFLGTLRIYNTLIYLWGDYTDYAFWYVELFKRLKHVNINTKND